MTGVELALLVLTVIMVVGGSVIYIKTRSWQWPTLWVGLIVSAAYELHLIG